MLPELPGQVQLVLLALALNQGTLSAQQLHKANQIVLDGSLCRLPQAHNPTLLSSPESQACVCADADAGADSKEQVSQPQHQQEFPKEAAPSQGISPYEKSKEHAQHADSHTAGQQRSCWPGFVL